MGLVDKALVAGKARSMKILDLYIGRAVILGTIVVMAVLLTLLGFLTLMDELGDVGEGRYQVGDAFLFVLLTLPRFAYELSPIAALLGSLIGLGGLANNSELIAMRAAGVSYARIALSVLQAGVLMLLVALFFGEIIAPETEQYAQTMRSQALAKQVTLKTKYGFWARDGGAYINIRNILPGSRLEDIYIYEYGEDKQLKFSTHAASARYENDQWLLQDIRQSQFTDDGVQVRAIERATWDSMLDPGLLNVVSLNPNILPAWGLYKYIRFLHANGQDAKSYEVAFWGKMVTPLVTLVMLYLSMPFVFGQLRSSGIGQRVFLGAMVGSGFFLMSKAFSYMAIVYDLNALFAASFPGLLLLGAALFLSSRVN